MNKTHFIYYILSGLTGVGFLISLWIVYNEVESSFAYYFLMAFLSFSFVYLGYILFMIVLKMIKMPGDVLKKRFIKFVSMLAFLIAFSFAADLVFSFDGSHSWYYTSVGMAVAFSFSDVFFKKKSR